jgi:hypothetical protein
VKQLQLHRQTLLPPQGLVAAKIEFAHGIVVEIGQPPGELGAS